MTNIINLFGNTNTNNTSPVIASLNQPEDPVAIEGVVMPNASAEVTQDYTGQAQQFFNVDNLALGTKEHGLVENKRGIFVDGHCINVVSPSYEVHQPIEIYNTFDTVARESGLEINRVLTNPMNGGLMISAKFGDVQIMDEKHDINLTFYTSHCGKYKTFLTLDLLRIACFNQVPALYRNKDRFIFAEKHYRNALDMALVQQAIENIPASIEAYARNAEALAGIHMTANQFFNMYVEANKIDVGAKRVQSKLDNIRQAYTSAAGQDHLQDSAYKAYQAITWLNTHTGRQTGMQNERVLVQSSADSLKWLNTLLSAA